MVDDGQAPHPADMDEGPHAGGRVPPHNLDAEANLLGAMLLNRDAIADAQLIVTTDDFYKPAHAHIFDAIGSLYADGEPADPTTVAEVLQRAGLLDRIGGAKALVDLESTTPATSNAAYYAKIIEERAMMRKLIAGGGEVAQLGYDVPDDVDKAVDAAESIVFRIAERRIANVAKPLHHLLDQGLTDIELMLDNPGALTGVRTGFPGLDQLLGGLQNGALYTIGARPATGKTSLALGITLGVATVAKMPVLLFSLEMSEREITQRLLCMVAEVDSKKIRTGQLNDDDWKRISRAVGILGEAPIWVVDNASITVMEMRAIARREQARNGTQFGAIVIDYFQLMSGSPRRGGYENRQVEVAEISRGTKVLARDMDCPVVALSQLSRGVEARADKRPTLADLRESGAIEQDSDVVAFIYRKAMYDRDGVDDGDTELIVAKHRNGPTGTVHLTFMPRFAKFEEQADL
jgi:replicative DNA helicase